jgi:hypothetical protein
MQDYKVEMKIQKKEKKAWFVTKDVLTNSRGWVHLEISIS